MRLISQVVILVTFISPSISITGIADIGNFRNIILDRHNEYRRSERASNMREMEWDTSLARKAEQYARQCRYERPARSNVRGENLFFDSGYAKNWHSRRKMMVMAESHRIGCGMAHCATMGYGRNNVRHSSLFVCFYSPRGRLIGNYPYERGRSCSRCPKETRCRNNLCSSLYSSDSPANIVAPNPPRDSNTVVGPILPNSGPLSSTDKQYVLLVQNRMRENKRLRKLEWNNILEMWASYVIRCDVEYPGPRQTYSNFGKIDRSQAVQQLIYEWADEGEDMMEPSIRRMGCAAMACDRKRQLTCIYDDRRY
ncbi:hypothetical protein LOTGIDRAFT_155468 [Lottia gigantea]|uniref:SCP domain-containing protein n=1 Tax=Lottia gigantea TaxID=225164 RepID=V3Z0V1_LOTGI|nr:hypothetical protein LOTGIDRAFT_155468 [Lottia gigantea]ESO84143.1 hypothetical protein LOTGIDRAFT_155468 [Lottia gigantea]